MRTCWRVSSAIQLVVTAAVDDRDILPEPARGQYGWAQARLAISHGSLGGVTDGTWTLTALSRQATGNPPPLPKLPPQPLAIFIDKKR